MNTLFLAAAGGGNNMLILLLFVGLMVLMYFTMIRPQKKQQQKRVQMMDKLKKGDQVILVDGLHAKIDSINSKDKTIVVDADGIYLTFSRMAVRQILPSASATAAPKEASATTNTTSTDKPVVKDTDKPADTAETKPEDKPAETKADDTAEKKDDSDKE